LHILTYGYILISLDLSTTGGGSATPTTVNSLSALKTALASGNKVVIISGTITGNEVIKVLPNTTVLGKSGASKFLDRPR
jgi:pectate lyase